MSRKASIVEQFRYARFTPEDYQRDQSLMHGIDAAPCITFNQFRVLAKRQGWTVDFLTSFVKGEIDSPQRALERILKTGPADTVIPYTCLIELYRKETLTPPGLPGEKSCTCGCGGKVRGKQKFATSACQRRVYRQRHQQHPTQLVKSTSNG